MISRGSGQRRKRELGIAAPSPFTYFLSPQAPALAPARGRGRGRRRQPPGSARPSSRAGAGPRAPSSGSSGSARPFPLPASRRSLRNRQRGWASLPPLAEARAGSLGDEKLPGRTRSRPTPGLRLSCRRRSRVPAETLPPPSSRPQPPGIRPSPRRFPPTPPAGPQTTPSLPADAAPPLRGFLQLRPPPVARLHGLPDVQPPQAPAPDARPHGLRLPPRQSSLASRGPGSPSPAPGPRFPPSHPGGGS